MRRAACWIAFALLVGGCETPQAVLDQMACESACRCIASPLPREQAECASACVADLAPVSEPCADCIFEHADRCATIDNDCGPLCSPTTDAGGSR